MDLSLDDLVCLYVLEREPSSESSSTDGDGLDPRSPTGIAAGIGIEPDDISGRLDVFESVTQLTDEDYLTETVRTTDGVERNVYELSPEGRERARTLRRQVLTEADGIDEPGDRSLREVVTVDGDPSLGTILARLSPDGSALGGASAGGDRFVGRPGARSALNDALAAIEPRGGRTILVTGDRGVGKSMLVSQLLERARESDVAVGRSACRRESDEPYGPLRRAIEDAFDASVCAPLAETDRRGTEDAASLSARRSALLGEVADAVCDRSTDQPTALFVDDLHWAGDATIALFERLATASAAWVYPILLVGAYRPAEVTRDTPLGAMCNRLSTVDRVSEFPVEPFDWEETGRFVRQRVHAEAPESVIDRIHEASGGVPLIVDEAVTTMLESGSAPTADDDAFDALDVPAGAERAIERRLEPLDADGTQVLEAASVVGRTVPYDVLRSIVSLSDPDLREYVRLLVSAGILTWTDESATDELAFASDLVRETVRAGIDSARSRRLHDQIANALVETDAPPATIATHCEAAGRVERAIEYYERAADRARNRYAGDAAVETYERALELAAESDVPERAAALHLELAVTLFLRGEFDAAAEHFATARDRTDDRTVRSRASHRLAEIQVKRGAVETGIATAETALENATDAVPAADRCRLHRVLGWGRLQAGDLAGARGAFERQLAVAESASDPTLCALAEHDLGTLAGKTGDVEGAKGRLSDAVGTFDRLDEPNLQSKSLTNLALVHRRSGDLEAAIEANDRALSLQREHGFYETLPDSQLNQAVLYRARGRLDRAVEEFEAAIETAADVGREERVAKAMTNMAAVMAAQGRLDGACRRCCEAIDTFDRLEATDGLTLAYTTRARIRVLAGEDAPARADAERALSLATELGNDDRIAGARNVLGRVCRAAGELDDARAHHEAAADLAADGGDDVAATTFRTELVADMLAAGTADHAREVAVDAVDAAGETEERLLRARARTRLGRACTDCGDHERAATALERALETQERSGATVDRCETLLARSRLELDRGRPEAAADPLELATALIDEYGLERYAERARTYRDR